MSKINVLSLLTLACFTVSPYAMADTDDQMDEIEAMMADKGFETSHEEDLYDIAVEGEEQMASLDFTEGKDYILAAVCDNDCTDIDLAVYDEDGYLVGQDDDEKDVAVVGFTAAYTGTYEIGTKIYQCSTDKCYYRVRSFRVAAN